MKKLISTALSIVLLCGVFCTPAFAIKSVTTLEPEDVLSEERIEREQVSDWAADELNAAQLVGLIPKLTGNPGYQDAITREQFAELATHMVTLLVGEGPDASGATAFDDCDNASVIAASAAGIVSGVGGGKFDPTATTNREQIATMVARAIVYIDKQSGINIAPSVANIDKFSDKEQVSAWAIDGVGALASNGIMSGTSATTLSPKNSCTVEQSILLLYRVYEQFQAKV